MIFFWPEVKKLVSFGGNFPNQEVADLTRPGQNILTHTHHYAEGNSLMVKD